MKLKITIGENDRVAIVLPIEHAGLAAQLLSNATVYHQTGYYGNSPWEVSEKQVRIEYTDEETLAPATKRELEAIDAVSKKNTEWAAQYSKANQLQKQVDELTASLKTLQGSVVCTVVHPEHEDTAETGDQE